MTFARMDAYLGEGARLKWLLAISLATAASGLGVAIALSPGLTLVGIAALVIAGVILLRPSAATPLVIGLIYSNVLVVGAQFHGLPYVLAAGLPAVLIFPILHRLLISRKPVIVPRALPIVFLYLLVHLLAAVASGEVAASLEELSFFVSQGLMLYLAITNCVDSPQAIRHVTWAIVLVGALMGGLSLVQEATDTHSNDYYGFAQTGGRLLTFGSATADDQLQARAAGPIGEKNRYAQVLLVLVPLGLTLARDERSRVLRLLSLGSTIAVTAGVVLTFSRGAAVGVAILLVGLVALRVVSVRMSFVVVAAALLIGLAMPHYVERLASLEDITAATAELGATQTDPVIQTRANVVLSAMIVFVDNPVLGIGPGRFSTVYRDYSEQAGGLPGDEDFEAHSLFPGIAAELGLAGLAVFGAILFVTLRDLARARNVRLGRPPDLAKYATGYLLAIVAYLVTSLFLHMSFHRYFWTLLAVAGATAYVALNGNGATKRASAPSTKARLPGA